MLANSQSVKPDELWVKEQETDDSGRINRPKERWQDKDKDKGYGNNKKGYKTLSDTPTLFDEIEDSDDNQKAIAMRQLKYNLAHAMKGEEDTNLSRMKRWEEAQGMKLNELTEEE